jgi:hypothetical protein
VKGDQRRCPAIVLPLHRGKCMIMGVVLADGRDRYSPVVDEVDGRFTPETVAAQIL